MDGCWMHQMHAWREEVMDAIMLGVSVLTSKHPFGTLALQSFGNVSEVAKIMSISRIQ